MIWEYRALSYTKKVRKIMETDIHWKYFLALDNDFGVLSRYIEPCAENFNTYSLEIARLLMAASQECDVMLKRLCEKEGTSSVGNEKSYREVLTKKLPSFSETKINITQFQLEFTPYQSWGNTTTPEWWTANNKIKHHRATDYGEANLKNLMGAISGLLVANIYYHRDKRREDDKTSVMLSPQPKYFSPVLKVISSWTMMEREYHVPD